MKKLDNISFLKTTMMLVVVLYHSMLFYDGNWFPYVEVSTKAPYIVIIASWLNTFHVAAFCMASGFIFYYLKNEKGKYKNPKEDILKRAKRLILPCISVCYLWALPFAIYFYRYSFQEIFHRYILMSQPNQLWFLLMLFWVFVIFELLLGKTEINFKNIVIIYFFSTIVSNLIFHFNINFFQIGKAIQFILYFYLGGYIYKNKRKIKLKQVLLMIIMSLLLYPLSIFLDGNNSIIIRSISLFIVPIVSILEVSTIYYLCTYFVDKKNAVLNNKIYKLFESNSFGIYLFHQQIIYISITLFNGLVHPILHVIISFVLSLLISLMMSIIFKKNKLAKTIFGL